MSARIQHVYIGESIRREAPRMLRAAKRGKVPQDCWLITLAENPGDELEIIHSYFMKLELVSRKLPKIVGIAGTRGEAFDLLLEMTKDCFRERGDACLKEYLG